MSQAPPISFVDPPKQMRKAFQSKTPCKDGRTQHRYDPTTQVCIHCGHKRPYDINSFKTARANGGKERGPSRPSSQKISQLKARSLIFGAGTITQRLVLQLVEEEKRGDWIPDALSAEEMLLLSDALADEAIRSKRILAWLAMLDQVGPHAKLATVVAIIALPRMARHGMIPQEVADELANAAALALASGSPRDDNWGDVRGQVDVGGGGAVTTPPIPPGEQEQDGSGASSSQVPSGRGREEPYDFERREVQPDRTATDTSDTGDSVEGVLPGVSNGVAPRGMDRVRRRGMVS